MIGNDQWSHDDEDNDDDDDDDDQLLIEKYHFLTDHNHFILKMIVLWLKTILL
jgi:hypothetical protein